MPHPLTGLARDEISETLGDKRYIEHHYIAELKARLLGPYTPGLIGVSRFYRWMTPPVIVDFEPSPLDGKFYCEEKRAYCHEQRIVYVPIFLRERLTSRQFAERVKDERASMEQGSKSHKAKEALLAAGTGPWATTDADMERRIDEEALRRLASEIAQNTHLRGASRAKRLRRLKLAVIEEARRGRRNNWGASTRASMKNDT
jgi:hypothetical protein